MLEDYLTYREVIDLVQPYFDEKLRKRSARYVGKYYRMERFLEELYGKGPHSLEKRGKIRDIVDEVFRDGVICGRREINDESRGSKE